MEEITRSASSNNQMAKMNNISSTYQSTNNTEISSANKTKTLLSSDDDTQVKKKMKMFQSSNDKISSTDRTKINGSSITIIPTNMISKTFNPPKVNHNSKVCQYYTSTLNVDCCKNSATYTCPHCSTLFCLQHGVQHQEELKNEARELLANAQELFKNIQKLNIVNDATACQMLLNDWATSMHAQIDKVRNEIQATLVDYEKEIDEKKDGWKTYLSAQLEQTVGCLLTDEVQKYESDGKQIENARLEFLRLQKTFDSLSNRQLVTLVNNSDQQFVLNPPVIICSDIFINGFNFMDDFDEVIHSYNTEKIELERSNHEYDDNSSSIREIMEEEQDRMIVTDMKTDTSEKTIEVENIATIVDADIAITPSDTYTTRNHSHLTDTSTDIAANNNDYDFVLSSPETSSLDINPNLTNSSIETNIIINDPHVNNEEMIAKATTINVDVANSSEVTTVPIISAEINVTENYSNDFESSKTTNNTNEIVTLAELPAIESNVNIVNATSQSQISGNQSNITTISSKTPVINTIVDSTNTTSNKNNRNVLHTSIQNFSGNPDSSVVSQTKTITTASNPKSLVPYTNATKKKSSTINSNSPNTNTFKVLQTIATIGEQSNVIVSDSTTTTMNTSPTIAASLTQLSSSESYKNATVVNAVTSLVKLPTNNVSGSSASVSKDHTKTKVVSNVVPPKNSNINVISTQNHSAAMKDVPKVVHSRMLSRSHTMKTNVNKTTEKSVTTTVNSLTNVLPTTTTTQQLSTSKHPINLTIESNPKTIVPSTKSTRISVTPMILNSPKDITIVEDNSNVDASSVAAHQITNPTSFAISQANSSQSGTATNASIPRIETTAMNLPNNAVVTTELNTSKNTNHIENLTMENTSTNDISDIENIFDLDITTMLFQEDIIENFMDHHGQTKENNFQTTTNECLLPTTSFTSNEITENIKDDGKLDLSQKDLTDIDIPLVVRFAFENNGLEKLFTVFDISNNKIGAKGASCLSNALQSNSTLLALNLQANQIENQGTLHLSNALTKNRKLVELDISQNQIGFLGAQYLSNALKMNDILTILNLDNNHIGAKGAQYLSEALQSNYTLKTLKLNCCHLEENGTHVLCDALKTNISLTTLELSSNRIGEKGALHINMLLRANKTITTLILRCNQIGETGAFYVSDALRINETLTDLNIERNQIRDDGVKHISDVLRQNKTLLSLNLSNNLIGHMGAEYISNMLQINKTLKYLDFSNNGIKSIGARFLSDAIRKNKTLTRLNLQNNRIAAQGITFLKEVAQENKTLTAFEV